MVRAQKSPPTEHEQVAPGVVLCVEDRMSKRWMPRTIDDAPDRLILCDGVCVLCSWWVRFVIERDTGARFRFVAIQTPRGSALATRLGVDFANPETNVAIISF